jgi:tagatose-1,6-bisphosphate aldolase
MRREQKFLNLEKHAWYSRIFSKLNSSDIIFCLEFIRENDHFNSNDFAEAVNTAFLDNPNKPKNWKYITELLACTNQN